MGFQMKMPGAPGDDVKKSLRQIHSWLYQLNETLHYTFSHLDEENFTDEFLLYLGSGQSNASSSAIEGVSLKLAELFSETWTPLQLTASATTDGTQTPAYCLRGRDVHIRGGIRLGDSLAANASISISTLPDKACPAFPVTMPVCSDGGCLRLTVQTDGTINLQNTSENALPASAFVSLNCGYAL